MKGNFSRRFILWAGILGGMIVLGQGLGHPPEEGSPAVSSRAADLAPRIRPDGAADAGSEAIPSLRPPPARAGQATDRLKGYTVCLDPGHQARVDRGREPVGPGSKVRKLKGTVGAVGAVTRTPEHKLTLLLATKLEGRLRSAGARVVLTRGDGRATVSNIARAQTCSREKAQLFLRIHADGSPNPAMRGISVLYPDRNRWTAPIYAESLRAAELFRRELLGATGAKDLGLRSRGDLTGFNWSRIPVVLAEVGYLSNPEEDRLLQTAVYQDRIVAGFEAAVRAYLKAGPPPGSP